MSGSHFADFLVVVLWTAGFLAHLARRVRGPAGDPPPDPSRLYSAAAAACALTDVERRRGFWTVGRLEGRAGSFRVRLERCVGNNEDSQRKDETRISIERIAGQELPIALRAESFVQGFLLGDRAGREIEIGDKHFDDDFNVTGPHTFVRALLDAPTRRLLRALLLETGLEVSRGRMRGRLPVTTAWAEHDRVVGRTLGHMLQIARHFERPRDVTRRLAANARQDPVPEVRLQNLLTLVREYPEEPDTEQALVAACADPSNWIRVRAATALGERGRVTLLELAAHDPPDEAATPQAITVLGRSLPAERLREILTRSLRARQHGTARACLAVLGQGPNRRRRDHPADESDERGGTRAGRRGGGGPGRDRIAGRGAPAARGAGPGQRRAAGGRGPGAGPRRHRRRHPSPEGRRGAGVGGGIPARSAPGHRRDPVPSPRPRQVSSPRPRENRGRSASSRTNADVCRCRRTTTAPGLSDGRGPAPWRAGSPGRSSTSR